MVVEKKDDSPETLTEAVLVGIERALSDFIESLKETYDNSEDRMIFVGVYSVAFLQGPLYLGALNLHKDEKDSIANKTLQSLGAILTSYQGLKVDDAALEFKITILSKDHVKRLKNMERKKRKLPRNILGDSDDENDFVGSAEPPNKKIILETKRLDSILKIPNGYPSSPKAFENICLLTSIAVGILYHEAQAEAESQKETVTGKSYN